MEMKTAHRGGIGGAVARIAAELRDFRMAPDTLRKEVRARYAAEIAEGKEGYGKRLGDVGYDVHWSGPYGLTRAATKAVEREVLEQVIREQRARAPQESCFSYQMDLVPMQISSGVREFRLEKVLS